MTTRRWWLLLVLMLAPLAQAASVHAFLDRDHVSLGHAVTLNIQSTEAFDTPDLSALQNDFQVLGTSRSSSTQVQNGHSSSRYQLGIALRPLHAGTLTIPPLDVGSSRTQTLVLHVGAAPSGGRGKVGDPVFMEAGVRSSAPYVGQQTVYTVRLFYQPGVDGSLANPTADGARLIQLDHDHRYVTQRDGYTYRVIERSWALIPGRSGAISVEGPVFQGRRQGQGLPGWFNDPNALLNSPFQGMGSPVRAVAPTVKLNARAAPANAGKPWLPARDVKLKLSGLPSDRKASVGVPVTVTLSVSARGMPADSLPELQLPAIPGARVYPDQVRNSSDDSGEWLQGTRTRSFAIVPTRDGTLTIPAITLNWWDVVDDRARQARLPAHTLQVTGSLTAGGSTPALRPAASVASTPGSSTQEAPSVSVPATVAARSPWRAVALASIALWLLAVVAIATWWWLRRRSRAPGPRYGAETVGETMPPAPRPRDGGPEPDASAHPEAPRDAKPDPRALQRQALEAARAGDAPACEHALLAWARVSRPGLTSIGALRDGLSDPAQRDALEALQRARWQGGDAAPACEAVAKAFAPGFKWRTDVPGGGAKHDDLPPLYPPS